MTLYQTLKHFDKLRQDIHFIIEEVALKEMSHDPVGFLKREGRRRSIDH